MAVYSGVTALVYIADVLVASQRNVTLNREKETIDVTSKDSAGWKEFLQGSKSWSLDCDGLVEEGDSGYEAIKTMWLGAPGAALTEIELILPDGSEYSGSAIVTSLSNEGPMDDAETFKASFQGSGILAEV
jgi:TP901-1 family phage major tail protein